MDASCQVERRDSGRRQHERTGSCAAGGCLGWNVETDRSGTGLTQCARATTTGAPPPLSHEWTLPDGSTSTDVEPCFPVVADAVVRLEVDVPGRGFSFRFIRRHVSGISYDGPLGHNWDFNYNMRIVVDGSGHANLHDGTGRRDQFRLSGGSYSTPVGRFEELTKSGSPADFFLTKPNGTVYKFEFVSGLNWRLETITDRAGNVALCKKNSSAFWD